MHIPVFEIGVPLNMEYLSYDDERRRLPYYNVLGRKPLTARQKGKPKSKLFEMVADDCH
ncbi:MAG: hypothetical protein NG747_03520 [Candidatus Brocadia sp.]|nr:hypothetical protein [Candidatus Brocadia sp.]